MLPENMDIKENKHNVEIFAEPPLEMPSFSDTDENPPPKKHKLLPKRICPICKQVFSSSSNLTRHKKRKHKYSVDDLLDQIEVSDDCYKCIKCGKKFDEPIHIRLHLKTHEEQSLEDCSFKCPLCSFATPKCSNTDSMHMHFYNEHGIVLIEHEMEFANIIEFDEWKKQEEQATLSRYIVRQGSRETSNDFKVTKYFLCQRSGFYKPLGTGKRAPRKQGSKKINGFCPARIRLTHNQNTGLCYVNYLATHVGHSSETDVHHLTFTKEERQIVYSKIRAGMSSEDILNQAKCSDNKNLQRLTRKNIRNFRLALALKDEDKKNPESQTEEENIDYASEDDTIKEILQIEFDEDTKEECLVKDKKVEVQIIPSENPDEDPVTFEDLANAENIVVISQTIEESSDLKETELSSIAQRKEEIKNKFCFYVDSICSEEELSKIECMMDFLT